MASSSKYASLPHVPGTDPSRCVLDLFRTAIAQKLVDAFPEKLSLEQAYTGVDYGKKGEDFTVAIPRFRLPGKVDELAKTVIEKVCYHRLIYVGKRLSRHSSLQTTT
jgi:arginyl-tRNA synthetase